MTALGEVLLKTGIFSPLQKGILFLSIWRELQVIQLSRTVVQLNDLDMHVVVGLSGTKTHYLSFFEGMIGCLVL